MTDIAPELYDRIVAEFERLVAADDELTALAHEASTYTEAHEYAIRLGEHLSEAFENILSSGVLPDGKMYYNIAERTVRPMLEGNRRMVNEVAAQVQRSLNDAAGIGIAPVAPRPNTDRVDGIINRLTNADVFDDVAWVLGESVVNFTQSCVDDYVQANAEFHASAGLSPKITRITAGHCCDWCASLAGKYDYDYSVMPKDIFRRHRFCRCLVVYDPGDGKYQNVHKKSEWYDNIEEAEIARRKKYGQPISNEEAQRVIRERIASGEYSLRLSRQHYLKHIEGTPQFDSYLASRTSQGKGVQSVLYLSSDEAQDYIRKLAGIGTVRTVGDTVYGQEYATCDKIIGKYYEKGEWHDTKRAMLIYGKRSSHIVPVKEID